MYRRLLVDDDDETTLIHLIFSQNKKARHVKWSHERVDWTEYVQKLHHTRSFETKMRMPYDAFQELVTLLRPRITVDEQKARAGGAGSDPIYPEMVCAIGLRFLAGEMERSLDDVFGLSLGSTHRIINKFLIAVNECKELEIKLPETTEELKNAADGWHKLSSAGGFFYGVVGCIDGWLCTHNRPKVDNGLDYFSGHYQCFGSNVQAICDANLRFIYVSFAAPGKTNDVQAFRKLGSLHHWQRRINIAYDAKYFLLGDNAYVLNDSLLIPYSGASRRQADKDAFNFYLSQLRIRIEMTFGRLCTKWRVFRRDTSYSMTKMRDIVNSATRLHNFIIDYQLVVDGSIIVDDVEPLEGEPSVLGYRPTAIDANDALRQEAGSSDRREWIRGELEACGLRRPDYNVHRNQEQANHGAAAAV